MSEAEYEQLDPRQDEIGLYLWGTIGWFVLLFLGAAILIFAGHSAVV